MDYSERKKKDRQEQQVNEAIYYTQGIQNARIQNLAIEALMKIPQKDRQQVMENTVIVAAPDNWSACYIPVPESKDIILLMPIVSDQTKWDDAKVRHTVLHEAAHHYNRNQDKAEAIVAKWNS